jgi:hypothetical protein
MNMSFIPSFMNDDWGWHIYQHNTDFSLLIKIGSLSFWLLFSINSMRPNVSIKVWYVNSKECFWLLCRKEHSASKYSPSKNPLTPWYCQKMFWNTLYFFKKIPLFALLFWFIELAELTERLISLLWKFLFKRLNVYQHLKQSNCWNVFCLMIQNLKW